MFSTFSRMLGIIAVKESPTTITIEGLPGNTFGKDISKTWGTNKITNSMFSQLGTSKVAFNKFFAVDVLYMLQELRSAPRDYGVNRRALKKSIDELLENSWLRNLEAELPDILDFSQLKQFKKTPLEHQQRFLHVYNEMVPKYQLTGYMLAAEPGAGKTINGLMTAACLKADVTIIISPNNAVYKVWKKTCQEEYVKPVNPWVAADKEPLTKNYSHYIFHYEALDQLTKLQPMLMGKNVVVIIDESHNFNEIKSNRTQFLVNFCKRIKCQHVLWASGTPIKAMGYELIPFLHTIDPFFDADSESRFKAIFGKSQKKAIDILRNRIGLVSFKVPKSLFIQTKPTEHNVSVKVKDPKRFLLSTVREDMKAFIEERMTYYAKNDKAIRAQYAAGLKVYERTISNDGERKQYQAYNRYIAMIAKGYDPASMKDEAAFCNNFEQNRIIPVLSQPLKGQFKSARSVVKYVKLKIAGEALGRVLGKRRAECNVALIDGAGLPDIIDGGEKKTVIFTSFVDVAEQLKAYLEKAGYKPAIVYGATNKNLSAIINQFSTEEDCNPLIATYPSLSTAVPLTMANQVVLMNQPYREFERKQAIARADRIGQTAPVSVYNVLLDTDGEPNISTRAADIVQWSREQVAAIMGDDVGLSDDAVTGVSVESLEEMVPDGTDDAWVDAMVSLESHLEGIPASYIQLNTVAKPQSSGW